MVQVALESTGDYWKPVFNLLEESYEVVLVNAQHVKKVPGRKTDVSDAEWLAELMLPGLLRGSFIPAKPQRVLRELTRYRTTQVRARAQTVNRIEKLLEGTTIKLSSVVSTLTGVSATAILRELAAGADDPQALAELAKGRLRNKLEELEAALTGSVEEHQRFILALQLEPIDNLDAQIARLSQRIIHHLEQMPPPPYTRWCCVRDSGAATGHRHELAGGGDLTGHHPRRGSAGGGSHPGRNRARYAPVPYRRRSGLVGWLRTGQSSEWRETLFRAHHQRQPRDSGHSHPGRVGRVTDQRYLPQSALSSLGSPPR